MKRIWFVSLALVACYARPAELAPEMLQRRIALPPDRVLIAAEQVLVRHGAALGSTDRSAGIIQTLPFSVETHWEGVMVDSRVDCGKDMAGVSRSLSDPVTLTLGFLAITEGDSTTLRLTVHGSGYDRTARSMASTNVAAAASQGDYACTLRPEFATQLLDEVQAAAKH